MDKYVNFFNLYKGTKNTSKHQKSDFRGDYCGCGDPDLKKYSHPYFG